MNVKQPIKRTHDDAGFTLMESLVALLIFSAAILSFERAVAGAWRGINAANMKTGAVTLALRLLDETGADLAFASEQETEGQSGHYEWRRRVAIIDTGAAPPTASADDLATFWVEVKVAWLDGAARSAQSVRYRLLKTARRPT
jgi:prepilin-type N-terminal cleavage/methylation domain-containing protein